jgi:DNA-binding protein HU-beta
MTKADLVTAMATRSGLTKKEAVKALNAMTHAIRESLHQGDSVALVGFGTFKVARRAARQGRNPKTGASIKIPARRLPVFRPGKGLKAAV